MNWVGSLQEFTDWYIWTKTRDETELLQALRSVPSENWWAVWARIEEALHHENGKRMPVAHRVVPGKPLEAWMPTLEILEELDAIESKVQLLHQERLARQQQ